MIKKIKIILVLLTIVVTLSYMSETYSRYMISATNNIDMSFSNWQILVNEEDITSGNSNNIEITPVIEKTTNVKNNTIAPSSKGYFDILIDPSNVELSFDYIITLKVLNENLPDVLISKYAILNENYTEDTEITTTQIIDGEIKNTLAFDNNTKNFAFKPFTVRVYFEWFEGTDEKMNDEQDTAVATDALKNNTKLQIEATVKFEQNLNKSE